MEFSLDARNFDNSQDPAYAQSLGCRMLILRSSAVLLMARTYSFLELHSQARETGAEFWCVVTANILSAGLSFQLMEQAHKRIEYCGVP